MWQTAAIRRIVDMLASSVFRGFGNTTGSLRHLQEPQQLQFPIFCFPVSTRRLS